MNVVPMKHFCREILKTCFFINCSSSKSVTGFIYITSITRPYRANKLTLYLLVIQYNVVKDLNLMLMVICMQHFLTTFKKL